MLTTTLPEYQQEKEGRLKELAPSGWVLCFNYRIGNAEFLDSTMPISWQDRYVSNGIFLDDPIFDWIVRERDGCKRWSEIEIRNDAGVQVAKSILRAAASLGMRYGVAATRVVNGVHSFISLTRADREFTDAEVAEIYEKFTYWVNVLHNRASLTDGELDVLVGLRDGLPLGEIADRLQISLQTVKYRSRQAQSKLKALSPTNAVVIARTRGFI